MLHAGTVAALVYATWRALFCYERELISHAERSRDKRGEGLTCVFGSLGPALLQA